MDQTPRGRTSLPTQSMAPNTGHQHSPSYSLLASATLNRKVSYPFNKEWQAVCCVNEGYIRFGSPALYKEGSMMQITSTSQILIMVTH